MPILKNNKHELFAHPDYNCARWRHRHGKPGRLGFDRSFTSGHWPSVVDDKFYANLPAKIDEGELNTIASELLEGIRRDDESRREHLEMLSEGLQAARAGDRDCHCNIGFPRRRWKACRRSAIRCCSKRARCSRRMPRRDAAGGRSREGSR